VSVDWLTEFSLKKNADFATLVFEIVLPRCVMKTLVMCLNLNLRHRPITHFF